MSCIRDLSCITLPAEGESVPEFLARCVPSASSPGNSAAALGVGAVAPSFRRSPVELEDVAREWVSAFDGQPSMLEFGAARGLTFGAWQLEDVAAAEADAGRSSSRRWAR